MPAAATRVFSLAGFELDLARGELRRGGEKVDLRPKSFQVLAYLIENHGRLVHKDEIMTHVWGDRVVCDDSIIQCLVDIRRALGDRDHTIVRTVPRRGYLIDAPVIERQPKPPDLTTRRSPPSVQRLAVILVLLFIALTAAWLGITHDATDARPMSDSSAPPAPHSVAVLPFIDLSPAQDEQYLAYGIAEEVLHLLAQSPQLQVTARTSSFAVVGQSANIFDVAKRLDVAHVVEGSVRKSGDRIRVTVQLVETAQGTHLWSETYDRSLGDVLGLQTDIATAVAKRLEASLTGHSAAAREVGIGWQAYQHLMQGRFLISRRAPGDLVQARDQLLEAVKLAPDSARAWAALASAHFLLAMEGYVPWEEVRDDMRSATDRALALDPRLAEAHVRAGAFLRIEGDLDGCAEHLAAAASLEPNDPLVLSALAGQAAWSGRLDEAIALSRRAVALDPIVASHRYNLASSLLAAGRLDEGRTEYLALGALFPEHAQKVGYSVGLILIEQGHLDEAFAEVRQWPDGEEKAQALALIYSARGLSQRADDAMKSLLSADDPLSAIRVAEVYAFRGETGEAFRWLGVSKDRIGAGLRPAIESHRRWETSIRFSHLLAPLRQDPEWDTLIASLDPA